MANDNSNNGSDKGSQKNTELLSSKTQSVEETIQAGSKKIEHGQFEEKLKDQDRGKIIKPIVSHKANQHEENKKDKPKESGEKTENRKVSQKNTELLSSKNQSVGEIINSGSKAIEHGQFGGKLKGQGRGNIQKPSVYFKAHDKGYNTKDSVDEKEKNHDHNKEDVKKDSTDKNDKDHGHDKDKE